MPYYKMRLYVLLLLLVLSSNVYAQFFINVSPVLQMSSRNFADQEVDRKFYLDYLTIPKFAQAGVDYSDRKYDVFLRIEIAQSSYGASTNAGFSNFPVSQDGFNSAGFNAEFPSLGYFGYHDDKVEISLGRRKMGAGPGNYGLMLSKQNPAMDGFWLYYDPLKDYPVRFYGIFFGAASNRKANETYIDNNQRYKDENGDWVDSDETGNAEEKYTNNDKLFFFHKVGIGNERFNIGIAESYVSYNDTNFWAWNPFIIWHNTYADNMNAMGALTFDVKVVEQARIYGEFVLDDLVIGGQDAAKPTSMGVLVGSEWQIRKARKPYIGTASKSDEDRAQTEPTFAYKDGLIVGLEAIWTSNYFYDRGYDDPMGKMSFYQSSQWGKQSMDEQWPLFETYLGFPYGGATTMVELNVKYIEDRWNFKGSFAYLLQGEKASGVYGVNDDFGMQDAIPDNYGDWAAYTGDLEHSIILGVTAYYAILEELQLYMSLKTYMRVDQFDESTANVGIGISYTARSDVLTEKAHAYAAKKRAERKLKEAEEDRLKAEKKRLKAEEKAAKKAAKEAAKLANQTETANPPANPVAN